MIDSACLARTHPELGRATRLVVGYSGGLDSTVLLHLTRATFPAADLCALHVNHGLSPNAHSWQQHCASQCADWNVPFMAVTVTLQGGGIEASARAARYEAYRHHLRPGDVLLQAHHADDQAETVLFRMLRSGGSQALAAIPARRKWGAGQILRPLLGFRRAELEAYARHHRLSWIEDESNQDDVHDRNYLRLRVLPLLEQRWPHAVAALCTTATRARQETTLLNEWAEESLQTADERPERMGWSTALAWFLDCSDLRRRHVLRYWARRREIPVPPESVLEQFMKDLAQARADATPVLQWRGGSLYRYRNRLYLLPDEGLQPGALKALPWADFPAPLTLPDGFELHAVADPEGPLWLPSENSAGDLARTRVMIRFREGGERCTPHWRRQSHPLKKLLQQGGLEPWLRDRVPLLYYGGELAAVGDLWACQPFSVKANPGAPHGERWRLCWHRPRLID